VLRLLAAVVAVPVLAGGCSATRGDPAVWVLVNPATVTATTTRFTIGVTRLDCSSGVTGQPLTPWVTYEDQRVVIVAEVTPHIDRGRCQGNPPVPVLVELSEPIGDRDLVDGACIDHGPAVHASACTEPVRWSGP
jgi:hypothetical protein